MEERIRVLVADDSDDTRQLIKKLIDLSGRLTLYSEAQTGTEVLELLKAGQPDIVLMDINMPGLNGLETTERISRLYPNLLVIMMSVQGETEYLRKAMMSGAREYLIKPFNLEVMEDTLCSTYDNEQERQRLIRLRQDQETLQDSARTHLFFSTKGGVGKSVVALNTALALANLKKGAVALVDLDLQFGDLGILVNKRPLKTLSELVEDPALTDPEQVSQFMESVGGVNLLMAPKKPEMAEYITEQHIQTLFRTLKRAYRFVVVDTSVSFNEVTLAALDQADAIHYITTPDLLSLKNTRLGLDVLRSLHQLDKVNVVVNRGSRSQDISIQDIEKVLGIKPDIIIPEEEKLVLESINHGVPVMEDRRGRSTKFAKALQTLAQKAAVS